MPDLESLTVELPAERVAALRNAVEAGDYASSSEAVRDALNDWKRERASRQEEFEGLKAEVEAGLADIAAGRVRDFDIARIPERGRTLSADRSSSG